MLLQIDVDTQQLVQGSGSRTPLRSLEFKRGDSAQIKIQFQRGTLPVELSEGATGAFAIKENNNFDGGYLVAALSWEKQGEGANALYVLEPDFNTLALNQALGAGNDDPADDQSSITGMAEISWTEGGATYSTQTFRAIINNDVIRGDELPPESDFVLDWLNQRALRFDIVQDLTDLQKARARTNMGLNAQSLIRVRVGANQAARLALSESDATSYLVVDSDTGKSWGLLYGGDPQYAENWVQLGDRDLVLSDVVGLGAELGNAWQSGFYGGDYIGYLKSILAIWPGAMVYDFQSIGNSMNVQMPASGSFVDRFGVVRALGSSQTATIIAGRVQNISYDAQLVMFTTTASIPFQGVFRNPGLFSEPDMNGNVSFSGPFLFQSLNFTDFEVISLSFDGVDFSALNSVNAGGIADGFNLYLGTVISAVAEIFLSALSSSGADAGYFTCTLSDNILTPEAEAYVVDLEAKSWTVTITDP